MGVLKGFEIDVLQRLGGRLLSPSQILRLSEEGEVVELDFTGTGYFLTLRHGSLPDERVVLDKPVISGIVGDLLTGFVAFIENGDITLECHSFGGDAVPESFRESDVRITG